MTNATITLRKATPNDAADLAVLDDLAGNGLPSWLWQGAVNAGKAETAFDWGRARMKSDESYGWRTSWIASSDGLIAGKMSSYPITEDEDLETDIPPLVPIFELMSDMRGHWYLDSLAVYPEFRRKGIAAKLMAQALADGQEAGGTKIGLVVAGNNEKAMALYLRCNFEPVRSLPVIGYDGNEKMNESHQLMVRSI